MGEENELDIPAGRRHIIERPRLTRLLDETSARVIMLVAPAGYGKTTLARQWLAKRPHVWYQATAASSDVAALALGLADAAEHFLSDAGRQLRGWLPTTAEPEAEVRLIAELLSSDLASWPPDAWLGIDDYHLLASDAAQSLIDQILNQTGLHLLLTSRRRPGWATARHLLYGDFYELSQSSLAMSTDEATEILAGRQSYANQGLVALADGWPAVIGLAALAPEPLAIEGDDKLPTTLQDYFADEIYSSLSPAARKAVCQLALAPTITRETASTILDTSADQVLEEASRAGLFIPRDATAFEFHPLLRAFFLRKLIDLEDFEVSAAVTRTVRVLIGSQSWDDVFSLVTRFSRSDLLDELLAASIVGLTNDGRLSTLRQWLDYGRSQGFDSPLLDLADAELSFRQGLCDRAETLALKASQVLGLGSPLASSALCRAGQSRYFMDDGPTALRHFRLARQSARDDADARAALWGQFVVSIELERRDAPRLLREFESIGRPTRDSAVRVLNGKMMLAIRLGGIREAITEVGTTASLANDATDPIVRSSFWHIYAASLMLSANYERALAAVIEAVREVERFHVEFARPHTYANRAAAYIGLRRFREAADVLDEIETLANERSDIYLAMNAKTLRCRLLLNQGSPEEAWSATSGTWPRVPSLSQQAEFVATRAAASACAGRAQQALKLVGHAEELSKQLEPRLLCQWTRVLISLLREHSDSDRLVHAAFNVTVSSGALDAFVFAYRLNAEILKIVAEDPETHGQLAELLLQSRDDSLARRLGIMRASGAQGDQFLGFTAREQEVYALLTEGRTNRQIARALFISEVTVKVHVRHILRKLGVRTRTEAAVLGARTPLL